MLPDERLRFPHFLGLLSAAGIQGCWPARLACAVVLGSGRVTALSPEATALCALHVTGCTLGTVFYSCSALGRLWKGLNLTQMEAAAVS